jgi:branched-chain amino acid transport system permease protein
MLIQAIVNGLLFGAVYATIGIGFSLVWGVMNIINVAHGSFIMIGAYLSFTLHAVTGIDPFLSIPVVMAVLFGIAYVIQKYALNRVVRGSVFITLTFTFGLQILIANVCLLIWSADYRSVKLPYSSAGFQIGGVVIPLVRLGIFAVALILTGLFYLFMRRTKTGIAINATALNFEGAKTVGIDVYNIYAVTFGVSAALAGAAGCLISPIMSVNPFVGGPLVGKAFVIAILGGLGSTMGALVGGMVLGLVETVGTVFIPSSYQELLGFSVLVLVLVFRPQGLLGKRFYE